MLCQFIRKLIPAADTVSVSKVCVFIFKRLCDFVLKPKRLTVTGEYDLIMDSHFFRQNFLRQIGKSDIMKVRICIS